MLKNILSLMMNKFKKVNFLNIFFFLILILILGCAAGATIIEGIKIGSNSIIGAQEQNPKIGKLLTSY